MNTKKHFLILVADKEQEKALRELSKRIGGNDLPNMDKLINQDLNTTFDHLYLCVSDDFKESYIKCLHGWPDYMKYFPIVYTTKEFLDWFENEYYPIKDYEIIKHFPHASVELPELINNSWHLDNPEIYRYNLKMSDVGVDHLFKDIPGIEIKAKYSRLFCDVERFKDNNKEPMSKLGQGYMYYNFYDGTPFFRIPLIGSVKEEEAVEKYYDEHHNRLNNAVKAAFTKKKKVLLLDIHSYSDELADAIGKKGPYPDICIGINSNYYDEKILNLIIRKIKERGFSYQINFPYEGSIIPTSILDGTLKGELCTIMIEVNKRIYL